MRLLPDAAAPALRPTAFDLAVRHAHAAHAARAGGSEPCTIEPIHAATGIPNLFPLRVVSAGESRVSVVNRRLDGKLVVALPRPDLFAAPDAPAVRERVEALVRAEVVPLIDPGAEATSVRWIVDHFYAFEVGGAAFLTYATFGLGLERVGMTFGPGFGARERRLAERPLVLDLLPALGRYAFHAGGDSIVTNSHFVSRDMRYAIDLVPLDGAAQVVSPVAGIVSAAVDGHADDLPSRDPRRDAQPLGNYVELRTPEARIWFVHLARGSVTVRTGDRVSASDILGRIGNSGRSAEPHLHFHVSTAEGAAYGIPLRFRLGGEAWEPRRGAVVLQD